MQACGAPISRAELAGLDAGSLRIQDIDGELCPLSELSTGWRQLIILAARLALATVLGQPAIPLLVLEEPFAGLDQQRLACGVRLLAEFQRRTEWQVVLLTRDERVRSVFSDQLDNVRLVDLSRLG